MATSSPALASSEAAGEQGKRDSIVVVAQLSPEFTARLVDRWQELEEKLAAQPQYQIPQSLSEALRLAADLSEQVEQQQVQLQLQAPMVSKYQRFLDADGACTTTRLVNALQIPGINSAQAMHKALHRLGVVRRDGNGFQNHKIRVVTDEKGQPWFVLKDVLGAMRSSTRPADAKSSLEYELGKGVVADYPLQTSNLLLSVPYEWKGTKQIRTPGGNQQVTVLTEQGLYFFVARTYRNAIAVNQQAGTDKNDTHNFFFPVDGNGFQNHKIRVVTDEKGQPWFALKDVLEAMRSGSRTNDALASLRSGLGEGYDAIVPLQTSGGKQQITAINESGLTFLVARSNTTEGRKLNRFIHQAVLPAIRKDGAYVLGEEKVATHSSHSFAEARAAGARAGEMSDDELIHQGYEALNRKAARLAEQLKEAAPKAEAFDAPYKASPNSRPSSRLAWWTAGAIQGGIELPPTVGI